MIRDRLPPRPERTARPMSFLYDLLPVVFFFVAYKVWGIYVATAVLIAGVVVQTAISWFRHKKVSPMLLTSAVLVLVFGGLTLWIHDATFIKWKPTIVNLLFAGAFLASHFIKGPTVVQRLMGEQMKLEPESLWNQLSYMWIAFFVVSALANLYVAYNFSEDTWVNFKLFGMIGLTIVFALAQGYWLGRKLDQANVGNPAKASE
jgi:intracellular septation protein